MLPGTMPKTRFIMDYDSPHTLLICHSLCGFRSFFSFLIFVVAFQYVFACRFVSFSFSNFSGFGVTPGHFRVQMFSA